MCVLICAVALLLTCVCVCVCGVCVCVRACVRARVRVCVFGWTLLSGLAGSAEADSKANQTYVSEYLS